MQSVYQEDLVHRLPGDPSTLSAAEAQFAAPQQWVADETQQPSIQPSDNVADSQQSGSAGLSFTRVVIADLKPEVLQQIADPAKYEQVCRDLAHLYHYYLHGEHGNLSIDSSAAEAEDAVQKAPKGRKGKRKSPSPALAPEQPKKKSSTLPSGQSVPDIVIQHAADGAMAWEAHLVDVNDDTESLYLRAQQAQLPFSLTVPDHGVVAGVLWYFPFQNDQETLPLGHHPMLQAAAGQVGNMTQLTQAAQLTQLSQRPVGSQAPFAGELSHSIDVSYASQVKSWCCWPLFISVLGLCSNGLAAPMHQFCKS